MRAWPSASGGRRSMGGSRASRALAGGESFFVERQQTCHALDIAARAGPESGLGQGGGSCRAGVAPFLDGEEVLGEAAWLGCGRCVAKCS
ncbi:MAG: hypothetical protein J6386_13505 [Candidatus Synoicihabitans palmerolidicus]|nr:hypothetical protein [Candidatus Synoicihabitans palmerolidicus]